MAGCSYLSEFKLPPNMVATSEPDEAFRDVSYIVHSIPVQASTTFVIRSYSRDVSYDLLLFVFLRFFFHFFSFFFALYIQTRYSDPDF